MAGSLHNRCGHPVQYPPLLLELDPEPPLVPSVWHPASDMARETVNTASSIDAKRLTII
jgi:hypothetical protein